MTTRTDQNIHIDVMETLAFEPQLAEQTIAVAVKDGIVTLTGQVENHTQKVAAEQAVKRVIGVRGFAEELQVNPPTHHRRTDAELVEAILNTLKWSVLVPANHIQVKVEHGWVTLMGEVTWNFERESAQDAISSLRGVRGVSNKITIKPRIVPADVKRKITREFERVARQDAQKVQVKIDGGVIILEGIVQDWAEYDEAERAAWAVPGVTEVRNFLLVSQTIYESAVRD